jgi:alpha-1,6-mannosyltransferase
MVNRTSRYRWMMDLPALLRILYAERPDVVEAGDPYHAAMVARNWANRRGSKFYMFYHSHFPDALLRTVLKFLGPWARSVTEQLAGDYLRRLALSGNGVFVGSQHLIRILGGWGVPRLIHLPLGVDTKIFQPVSQERKRELRKKLGLPLETRVLLYVGRFSPDKDTALLLRAWSSLEKKESSDWLGVMVGSGQMKEDVDGYTRNHPRVRTTPFLKDPEALAEWYQAADLLLHPGRWETFGLVLLEAQACGLPVIAFRGGAMDEQSHDVTHWVTERSSEAFALAVQKKMRRIEEIDRKPLSSFIDQNFSWDKTFARQLAEYES